MDLRNDLEDACWRMWLGLSHVDGSVVPCCLDKTPTSWDRFNGRMASIWHNEAYTQFRNALFADRAGIPMCTNCSEGSHVYA